MKTELEEAAEKYLQEWRLVNNIHLSNPIHAERCKNNFIAGAEWMQEQLHLSAVMQRSEQLFAFLEYCDNAGWIKNIDKKQIIEDYEKANNCA